MSSRDAILSRIRQHVSGDPALELPPEPEVWPRESPSIDQMAGRFISELEAVSGEPRRCGTAQEARSKLGEVIAELGEGRIGAMDRDLVREIVSGLPAERLVWNEEQGDPKALAGLEAGVIEADLFLADTGSAMIAPATAYERLLCYLPAVSIVVGRSARLFEHMPAAWDEVAQRAADPALRSEFVLVTGPSRTADIEKILILGVHGPKRLVVMLVD